MLDDAQRGAELLRRARAGEIEIRETAKRQLPPNFPTDESGVDLRVEVTKVDESLGIVFGYAIVSKIDGEEYYDTQGDHIPEESMLRATADFMSGRRTAKVMHKGGRAGQVVFGFPLTQEIASALDISVRKTGFVVGMRPDDPDVLEKFRDGELTGFSIGGRRVEETVVEE